MAGAAEQLPEETSVSSPGLERHAARTSLGPQPSEPGVSQSLPSVPVRKETEDAGILQKCD